MTSARSRPAAREHRRPPVRRIVAASVGVLLAGAVGAGAYLVADAAAPGPLPSFTSSAPRGPGTDLSRPRNAAPPAAPCTHPSFETSRHGGEAAYGRYLVSNNMWNPLSVEQTLYACNYHSWYVMSTMSGRGGAVQTYPNAQMTFAARPRLGILSSLTSVFGESTEPSRSADDYEYAFDIWVNGYGGPGTSELMIWNYVHGQVPGGTLRGTFTDRGRTYDVYLSGSASGGDYIAFVARSNFTSGALDLVDFFRVAVAQGWIDHGYSARLWQVDYGVEICSTGGRPATFGFTNFDVVPGYS